MMFGAELEKLSVRKVAENKARKKGYKKEFTFYLKDVSNWAKFAWNSGFIYGDLVKFSKIREKLKKKMRKI